MQPFSSISHLFREFRHTAWRLETRRGYASDRRSSKWAHWQAGENVAGDASTWLRMGLCRRPLHRQKIDPHGGRPPRLM
ncbi:DUF6879 family protein [Streptomyces sp. NPDC056045]|uniref:DUF6879 family protein n=1 Tax=unclassified Streptomyces TaxID=2593676 RepID=UPI0035DCA605